MFLRVFTGFQVWRSARATPSAFIANFIFVFYSLISTAEEDSSLSPSPNISFPFLSSINRRQLIRIAILVCRINILAIDI